MTTRHEVLVVFDTETVPPMPLGIYDRADEDMVVYQTSATERKRAPQDCVAVVACAVTV